MCCSRVCSDKTVGHGWRWASIDPPNQAPGMAALIRLSLQAIIGAPCGRHILRARQTAGWTRQRYSRPCHRFFSSVNARISGSRHPKHQASCSADHMVGKCAHMDRKCRDTGTAHRKQRSRPFCPVADESLRISSGAARVWITGDDSAGGNRGRQRRLGFDFDRRIAIVIASAQAVLRSSETRWRPSKAGYS